MKKLFTKICIASDHAGYGLKEKIKDFLISKSISVIDLGPFSYDSVDYPVYAKKVAKRLILRKVRLEFWSVDRVQEWQLAQINLKELGQRNVTINLVLYFQDSIIILT